MSDTARDLVDQVDATLARLSPFTPGYGFEKPASETRFEELTDAVRKLSAAVRIVVETETP